MCITTGWPHEQSDLESDPSLIFGTLENGLRYVLMPNHEPKGRVAMYLNVQSGSLHETDEQRGVAHYLEHMLFEGSTHYPPGSLVEYFQSIGMEHGSDSNAHTFYDETVYKLLLPDGKEKTLDEGLLVLADYAGGALLLEKEVDQERGVILAEKRTRDSAVRRVSKKSIEQWLAGTLIAERDMIGTEEVLKTADSALLRQYYERWYRPENMMLVAVGDTDLSQLEKLIKKQFSGLKAKTAVPPCPDFGRVAESGTKAIYLFEPDLGYTNISLGSVWNVVPTQPSKAEELLDLKKYVAQVMMDNRLQHLVNQPKSPVTSASFSHDIFLRRLGYTSIDAHTSPEHWQQSLAALSMAVRQAQKFGFGASEFARAKSEILTQLKKDVQVADSRESQDLVTTIINSLNDNDVFMSPEQELALFAPALEKIVLAEVNQVFQEMWHGHRVVKVMGTTALKAKDGVHPKEIILEALRKAEQAEMTAWVQGKEAVFPYLPIPAEQGKVAEHVSYKDIGVERYVFQNGLILNLKHTDFEPNQINITATLGHGKLAETKPGLALLAEMLLPKSGVGGLTEDQLKEALAPYSTSVDFQVEDDSFQFQGKGLKNESELLFQLIYTYLYDPAFRENVFQRGMQRIRQAYAQLESSVEGMMHLEGERFLAGGNLRYGVVPQEMLKAITAPDIEQWLRPVFKESGLEISVVGDFDQQEILGLAKVYLGGQARKKFQKLEGEQVTFPSGKALPLPVTTHSEKGMVTVAWPTDDFWDIYQTRRLNMLASVLDDRIRKLIREELGAAYSPYAYNRSSLVDPGYGVLRAVVVVDPPQAEMVVDKLKQLGAKLATGKITADELERAQEPTLTSIRDLVRTNLYWQESVLVQSSRHPERLEWPKTIQSDIAAITVEEISALAAKYLQPEKAAEVILLPTKKE
ncbi:MAG: insulinase family protein [Candidatus Electrothrix sp. Rat3]|nr:insulinase family protein [Candidatus Electrothrix rattekaaiensis]